MSNLTLIDLIRCALGKSPLITEAPVPDREWCAILRQAVTHRVADMTYPVVEDYAARNAFPQQLLERWHYLSDSEMPSLRLRVSDPIVQLRWHLRVIATLLQEEPSLHHLVEWGLLLQRVDEQFHPDWSLFYRQAEQMGIGLLAGLLTEAVTALGLPQGGYAIPSSHPEELKRLMCWIAPTAYAPSLPLARQWWRSICGRFSKKKRFRTISDPTLQQWIGELTTVNFTTIQSKA